MEKGEALDRLAAELLGPYQVRKTVAQKSAFIEYVQAYAKKIGQPCEVQTHGRRIVSRNIILGDVNRARVLLTAHYDTCARLPFANMAAPLCWPLTLAEQVILPALVCVLSGLAFGRLCAFAGLSGAALFALSAVLTTLFCAPVIWLMLFGPANPHTANDNTSGVALVMLAAAVFSGRRDIAFVLFDNEEIGLCGSLAFAKAHPGIMRGRLVVQADCVSDGDALLYTGTARGMRHPMAKRLLEALNEAAPRYGKRVVSGEFPKVFYPSDQLCFARGTALAALKGKRILYLDRIHTAKDTVFDRNNLLCMLDAIESALPVQKT